MKSKNTTDLRAFLERVATKRKQPEPTSATPSPNESQMQLVIFEGQSGSETHTIPPEPERAPHIEAPIAEDDDESMALDESDSSDEDSDDDIYNIEPHPGLRAPISSYDVNDQDSVRRAYIALGRCKPKMQKKDFPQHECGGKRRFQPVWFDEYKWLEYSVDKDAAYCFFCYLFKDSTKFAGGDSFVDGGFRNWNMKARFRKHAGEVNSAHCEAEGKYNLFIKPKASIRVAISSQTTQYKAEYLARLKWSLECIKFILHQGLAFRGHDEGKDSKNKGNFRELLQWLAGNFEEVNKVVLGNAP
ncbi:hypothetical protein VPH35_112575 [Triticum aestivum]|uniref:zinc finger MYM-type protein 1-like n=1 Tax=Triticum aestivum TaxID=4565 RepID=UPI001D01B364|nr:zinc finger MYM-type protein 1-like [Triticum aestivum]